MSDEHTLSVKDAVNKNHEIITKRHNNDVVFDPRKLDMAEEDKRLWTSESVHLAIEGLKDGYELKESPYNKNVKDANLRKGNLAFKYSEEEIEIFKICAEDKVLFGNNFVQLKDGDAGWQQITLRSYQEDLLAKYRDNKWNLLMFPRQSGKTTTTVVEIVHFCCFNYDKDIVIIAQSETVVNEILSKVKNAFEGLPYFLQPGFISFSKKGFTLDNGCRCVIGIASESVVQGFALDFLFIDEFAYIPASRVRKFWNNIYPALVNNHNSKCIIASTPNGRNMFYELWQGAKLGTNRFVTSRIHWFEVPRRCLPGETPQEALERFKKDTIANVGLEGWLMGFECSFDTQLNSIFPTKIQQKLRDNQEKYNKAWSKDNHHTGNLFGIEWISQDVINYNLKKDFFLLGIDLAEGLGMDSTIIKIRKIVWNVETKELNYILVGIFRNNEIPIDDFARLFMDLMNEFDNKKVRAVVETNNYGGEFFSYIDNYRLYESKYNGFDNIIFAKFERASKGNDFERGLRWDASKKKNGVSNYRSLMVNGNLDDTNETSIDESLNFGRTSTGSYAAQYGHDDLVMADVTLSYYIRVNNLFSKAFLLECQSELRIIFNDIDEAILKEQQAIERAKQTVYTNNGFVLRNSKVEVGKRQKRKRGGNKYGHYLP